MEQDESVKRYDTPLYNINHAVITKPKVTESMRKDMKKFLSKL